MDPYRSLSLSFRFFEGSPMENVLAAALGGYIARLSTPHSVLGWFPDWLGT